MIRLAGNWLLSQFNTLVNLDNIIAIDINEACISEPTKRIWDVTASELTTDVEGSIGVILFRSEHRGECDAYLAELFCHLHNREMNQLGRTRFEDRGPDGYPARFSIDTEPAKRNP